MPKKKTTRVRGGVTLKKASLKQLVARATDDKVFFTALMRNPKAAITKEGFRIEPGELRTLTTLIRKAKGVQRNIHDLLNFAREHKLGGRISPGGPGPGPTPPPEPPWPWPAEWIRMTGGRRITGGRRVTGGRGGTVRRR